MKRTLENQVNMRSPWLKGARYSNAVGTPGLADQLTTAVQELGSLQTTYDAYETDRAFYQNQANAFLSQKPPDAKNNMASQLKANDNTALRDSYGAKITAKTQQITELKKALETAGKTDPVVIKAVAEADAAMAKTKSRSSNLKIFAYAGGAAILLTGIGLLIHAIVKK